MTQLERIKLKIGTTGDADDALLNSYLDAAKFAILNRRYPYGKMPKTDIGELILEDRYLELQLQIAIVLYFKRGAEGQTAHSEGGISRTYESSDVPESLLSQVVPMVGVL